MTIVIFDSNEILGLIVSIILVFGSAAFGFKINSNQKSESWEVNIGQILMYVSYFFIVGWLFEILINLSDLGNDGLVIINILKSFALAIPIIIKGIRMFYYSIKNKSRPYSFAGVVFIFFLPGILLNNLLVQLSKSTGWTTERQEGVMSDCEKLINENRSFNILCYKREVMKSFPNYEDYNKMNADESTGNRDAFLAKMDDLCPCGENIDESEVESVDLPF